MRQDDILARFGGARFAALLPGTDAEEAGRLARRIRDTVGHHRFVRDDGTVLQCSVSVGLATCPRHGTEADRLLEHADKALLGAAPQEVATPDARTTGEARPAGPGRAGPAPTPPEQRSRRASVLLWGVSAGGLLLVGRSLLAIQQADGWFILLPLLALAIAAELLNLRVYEANRHEISFSFAIAVTMAAVTLLPEGAPLVSFTSAVVHLVGRRPRRLDKALFNLANPPLAAAAAATVYGLVLGVYGLVPYHLLAASAAVLIFYVLNVLVISTMISLQTRRALWPLVRESVWFGPINTLIGLTGALVGGVYTELGWLGCAIFAVPLLVMRFTLSFYSDKSRAAIEALRELNERLIEQEQENARLVREAERAAALEELSRLKSEFISIASHELRTPLTTILGFSELLLAETPPEDPRHRFLGIIRDDARQLAALVENLLDVSRIENGRLSLEPVPLDLAAALPPLLEALGAGAPAHALRAEVDPAARWVLADPPKLQQILANLVGNAVKYSPGGGRVLVAARPAEAPGRVALAVADEGVGIPPEHLGRVFERFQRVDSAATRGIRGTGLGLYIVKHLVELHGGAVRVESAVGRGSTFSFTLPAATPAPAGAAPPPASTLIRPTLDSVGSVT
jgi:signal transduction histidine kinase